jgi:hypothetical protein
MYVDEWDATGNSRSMMFKADRKQLDASTFRSAGWEDVTSGQAKLDFSFNGFWSAATTTDQDPESFNQLGTPNRVFTAGLVETETAPAFIWKGCQYTYSAFGQINELAPFSLTTLNTEGIAGAVRGQLAKAKGTVSATGLLGSVCQLGAPSATQYVYASLHIQSAGTTITVQVQSDDNAGMSSPTTRGTIGPITVAGGNYLTRVAGPFSGETHWRLNVSAITGTFTVSGAIAVQ